MKKAVLFLWIFLGAAGAYAQKAKVKAAFNYYKEPYQQYDKAKEAIEEAIANDQTKSSAEAWYYRGLIYAALYKNEKYGSLCDRCLQTSYESYKKSLDLDPKSNYAIEINALRIPFLTNQVFKEGVDNFNNRNYSKALESFELVQVMAPGDTSAITNSAFSAERAGNTEKAKVNYEKLIGMGVKDPNHFISLSNIYRSANDNAKALEVIRNGRRANPDTLSLMYSEINLLLAMDRGSEATDVINAALAKDASNESLYLVLGSNYDKLANPKDADGKELPKPANSAEMAAKAVEVYKQGLEKNPNSYSLNFNLGAFYFNMGADQNNSANKIKSPDESDKMRAKAIQNFKNAQPYLEKAMETNPRTNEEDRSIYDATMGSLKEVYARTNQTEKYQKISDQMK